MGARYDKYDGVSGGFRGKSNADVADVNFDRPIGASLNASGRVLVKDPGNSGFAGVTIIDRTKRKAGDILDIMTNGEIVYDSSSSPLTAGTAYFLNATTGELQTTETRFRVGQTVEAWRLVVRFSDQGAS